MKKRVAFKNFTLALLGSMITLIIINGFQLLSAKEYKGNIYIPYSTAEENILITSAGQSTDTYIVKDIVNDLMLHNYFMPKANDVDLESVKSAVVVIGYSVIGERLNENTYNNELQRLEAFTIDASNKDIPIIMVYIGGKDRRNAKTDELLELIGEKSSFIISTHDSNYDAMIEGIANKHDVPLSLVRDIQEIKEPLAALYR